MNSYTRMTNKLIDYAHYLDDKQNKDEDADQKSKTPQVVEENLSSQKKQKKEEIITTKLNGEQQNNKIEKDNKFNIYDQEIQVEIKEEDVKIEFQKKDTDLGVPNSTDQQKNQIINQETQQESNQLRNQNKNESTKKACCSNKENDPNKECDCCHRQNSFNEEEDDIFGHSNHTPSIDFTDIHSLIAWNNMRKLGFHYKQKDIVLIDRISIVFCLQMVSVGVVFLLNYFDLITLGQEYKQTWLIIMILLDASVVIYTQLNRVHIQVLINKSFLSSVKAIIKVQYLLQQSHLIDVQKHIIINKLKKKDLSKDDQILQFFLKIKSKMLKQESMDNNYYNKIMKVVQFIQNDIRYDLENDQLHFLGLIKATPAFEATLFTGVVGLLYWFFRIYMRYLNIDIGLLGQ